MYVISLAQRSIEDKSIPEIRYDTIRNDDYWIALYVI
jgi:hypothetical protein